MLSRTRQLAPLLLALAIAGCSAQGPADQGAEATELHTYAVPASQTDILAEALNEVLGGHEGAESVGHASSRVPGQLLVRAPSSVQASVADALKDLIAEPAEQVVQPRSLRFWRVDVRPGPDQGLERLAAMGPAVEALRKRFPGLGIALVEEASLAVPSTHGLAHLNTGPNSSLSVRTLPGDIPSFDVEFESPSLDGTTPVGFRARLELPVDETLIAATLNRDPLAEQGASVLLLRLEPATP